MDTQFKVEVNDEIIDSDNNISPLDSSYKLAEVAESRGLKISFSSKNPESKLYLGDLSGYAKMYDYRTQKEKGKNQGILKTDPSGVLFVKGGQKRTIIINDQRKSKMQLTPKMYGFQVVDNGITYHYSINVLLKDMTFESEWLSMRNYLVNLFSKDLISRNQSFKLLYSLSNSDSRHDNNKRALFQSILNNSQKLQLVTRNLINSPKFEIINDYRLVPKGTRIKSDPKSLELTIKNSGGANKIYGSQKIRNYDILANRYVKFMLEEIANFLKEQSTYFENVFHDINLKSNVLTDEKNEMKKILTSINNLRNFILLNLRTGVFAKVHSQTIKEPTKSIIQDPIYGFVYKQYLFLKDADIKPFFQKFNTLWKSTDAIYELWSYFHLIDLFLEDDKCKSADEGIDFGEWQKECIKKLIYRKEHPDQYKNGKIVEITKEIFYDGYSLNLIYQKDLRNDYSDGFHLAKYNENHFNPDIFIEIRKNGKNLGAIVLDCKYKFLKSCVNGYGNEYHSYDIEKLSEYRYSVNYGDGFKQSIRYNAGPVMAVHALLPTFAFKHREATDVQKNKWDDLSEKISVLERYHIYFDEFTVNEVTDKKLMDEIKQEISDSEIMTKMLEVTVKER